MKGRMKESKTRFGGMSLRVLLGVLCILPLLSCAEKRIIDEVSPIQASLTFLEDGKTTKKDLQAHLGPPSGEFNQGKIWTYSGLAVAHHLIVVFGDQDIVKTHRILKVR
jgi:hypothetical protein